MNQHEAFINHGEFNLEGGLENNVNLREEGSGIFRLIGFQTHLINLNGEFKTFNFEIDNSAGAVFLGNENVSVFGDLEFTDGILFTRDNNLVRFKPDAVYFCLLYTSPSPRDKRQSRMPSSA